MLKRNKIDLSFLYLFIPLLLLEILFHFIQFSKIDIFTIIRIILFVSFKSLLISFILTRFKNRKIFKIVALIVVIWMCFYSFAELIFKNFMGDFYSFGTVGDGATRIAQYAIIFLTSAKPQYYLCIIPIIVYILLRKYAPFNEKGYYQLPLIFCILSFLLIIPFMDMGSGINSILKNYATFANKDLIVDKMGINHFLFRDITALVYKMPDVIEIEDEPVIEDEPEVQEVEKKRDINDQNWKNFMNNEENENIKTVDKYLMSKTITKTNEKTGEFENYNFIYFMVEALDYLAIDEKLTPTLYKFYKNGYTFDNHYTPLYSCATGESEFVSDTSIFPYVNVCTPNDVYEDTFYQALPYLFKNSGYETMALHNWRDEFYERNILLPNLGYDNYYDIDDIWEDKSIQHTNGWQSDAMLIEQAIKHIEETDGKFFCNIITSVMHFPYNESSYWGDHSLSEVNEVHPDWPIDYKRYLSKCMDFDNGLKILEEYLESKGIADNTVICIYPDHRPYWLDYDTVMNYTSWINKREGEYGIYRSPFIFYNKNLNANVNHNYCSTLDHVPTIANLFNLHYDPRLYMGSDIYNGTNTVIFTNGNWLNENGIYDVAKEEFTPFEGKNVDNDYIIRTNNNVQNVIKTSYLILDNAYFAKRRAICYPRY